MAPNRSAPGREDYVSLIGHLTTAVLRGYRCRPQFSNFPEAAAMAQVTFSDDVLPPEGVYHSREALLTAINAWAKPRGYAFITGKSSETTNGRVKVIFACDRNGQPPNTSIQRQRRTCSRVTGYKLSILAKESLDKTSWVLSYRSGSEYSQHNHPPSQDLSAHLAHRKLSNKDQTIVDGLTNAGITSKDIWTYLRQNSKIIATQQDIYNRMANSKRDLYEGQSTINALANQLDQEGF